MYVLSDQRKQGSDIVLLFLENSLSQGLKFFSPRMKGIMFLSTILVNIKQYH